MKNFLILAVFISTMLLGLVISNSLVSYTKVDNYLHRNCAKWGDETLEKPLFTLQEAVSLIGKKVISKDGSFKNNETGRIISIEMVATDKFLVEIYWGKGVFDEKSDVTFHDKNLLSEDFEIFD